MNAAEVLADLRATGRQIPDLPSELQPATLADAYGVQLDLLELVVPPGERRIGYKVACTSEIAQQALRIDRPVFGRLLSHTTSPSGATLTAARFTHRVIEAEFGFRLASDVPALDGGHTPDTIGDYIASVIPAIEVVDYRYDSWTVGAMQVAADNAIHGWWVAGDELTDWRHLDLGTVAVSVDRNGHEVTTGTGAAVLGHPLNVMAWLANELPDYGLALRAGDYVTTGVTTDVFEADAGDQLVASFEGVGSVAVAFT